MDIDVKKIKKLFLGIFLGYWLLALLIFVIAGDGFRLSPVETDALSANMVVGEIIDGVDVYQAFDVSMDRMDRVAVLVATYARENTGIIHLDVLDAEGNLVANAATDISTAEDGNYLYFLLLQPMENRNGQRLILHFYSEGCTSGNAITFYAGNSVSTGKFEVEKQLSEDDLYTFAGQMGTGMLCIKVGGVNYLSFYKYYWFIVVGIFAIALIYVLHSYSAMMQGKNNFFKAFGIALTKYRFLIKQLVSRDFKVKYKRSVLGVAWSFLNPLLTMLVQYVVFSTIFKSSVPNFPVYLLVGTIFYSFFSEAISMGMSSVVGNASLIKKVYVPKYIYPVSRVLSSLTNFALSFLPLILVMIITQTSFELSLLLLMYDILCFLGFIMGMTLILSTAAVFFQDVQFLWGVVSMIWMYLTPIFYPESIIPDRFLKLYHLNPLYQYINFARTCIIEGISPHPAAYLGCLLPAVVFLLIGAWVFKRHQDKFVLYI